MPVYLGASLDIRRLIARPVEPRVLVLQSLIQELVASPTVPALLWQKVLGHLASLVDLVPNCRLLMRPLQLHFLRFFTPLLDSQSKLIPMSPEIKVLCAAWASPVRLLEGKPFSPTPPTPLVLTSDASQSGWGATLPPHRVSGTWSLEDSLVHINSLELKAVFLALESLEGLVAGQSLLIRSDNTTVVSYINFQGGTHSPSLCLLAIELWEWCILRGIYLLAAHIPGKDNLVADFLSRGKFLPSEWDSQSFDFSSDLSGDCPSAGDRPVCVHPQFSASQVLCPLPGSSSLESGRTLLPVVRPSTVTPSHPFRSSPQSWRRSPGRERTWLWWPPFGLRDHGS